MSTVYKKRRNLGTAYNSTNLREFLVKRVGLFAGKIHEPATLLLLGLGAVMVRRKTQFLSVMTCSQKFKGHGNKR